jgi:ABC-type transport system substrate-binding protein
MVRAGNIADLDTAEIWAESLKSLNITANIQQIDANTAFSNWLAGKFDMFILTWANDTPDAMEFGNIALKPVPPSNSWETYYSNPALVDLVNKAQEASTNAARQGYYTQIQAIVARDQPIIYIVDIPVITASSPNVVGFRPNQEQEYFFRRASFK